MYEKMCSLTRMKTLNCSFTWFFGFFLSSCGCVFNYLEYTEFGFQFLQVVGTREILRANNHWNELTACIKSGSLISSTQAKNSKAKKVMISLTKILRERGFLNSVWTFVFLPLLLLLREGDQEPSQKRSTWLRAGGEKGIRQHCCLIFSWRGIIGKTGLVSFREFIYVQNVSELF